MTTEEIRLALRACGSSYWKLSRELGCTDVAVMRVVQGKTVSDRIMRAVASKLNRKPEEVFPERFNGREKLTVT